MFLGKRAVRMLGAGLWMATRQPIKSPTDTSVNFRVEPGKPKYKIQVQRRMTKREQIRVRS